MSSTNSNFKPYNESFKPIRIVTVAERAEKKAKGLCHFCDQLMKEPTSAKQRRDSVVYVEILGDNDIQEVREEDVELEGSHITFKMIDSDLSISLHVVNEILGFDTMSVTKYYGKKSTQILVDVGNTHNFLDEEWANRVG